MEVDETTLRQILREELSPVEVRLDGLEARFDILEDRFDTLGNRFDILEDRFDGFESRLDKKFETMAAKFFGQWSRYLDDRLSEFEQRVDYRLENMESQLHAIIDRLDTDEIERAAMYAQMGRYEGWFHQLAKRTKVRLV